MSSVDGLEQLPYKQSIRQVDCYVVVYYPGGLSQVIVRLQWELKGCQERSRGARKECQLSHIIFIAHNHYNGGL